MADLACVWINFIPFAAGVTSAHACIGYLWLSPKVKNGDTLIVAHVSPGAAGFAPKIGFVMVQVLPLIRDAENLLAVLKSFYDSCCECAHPRTVV